MKLNILNLKKYSQMTDTNRLCNKASMAVTGNNMTVPTQIEPQGLEISSNASQIQPQKAVEALKAQALYSAFDSYKFIRDIKLPFSNKAKLFQLANGQSVVVLEKKGPTVLQTYYNVGSMNEKDSQRGISHFTEHMAFNGSNGPTGGLKSGDTFKLISKMGAITNASTGFSETNYYIASQLLNPNDFETCSFIHSEQLQYPEHSEEMVTKEKGPVTQEIAMVGDRPENAAFSQCVKNLYNISSTSEDLVAGSIDNINRLTRKDTLDYYNLWYSPDNCATVVTGEVPYSTVMPTLAKYFNKHSNPNIQDRKFQEFVGIQSPVRMDFKHPKAQTSTIAMAFVGPKNNSTKEHIIMEILMTSLLGYKNSRISKELNKIQANAFMNVERTGNRPTDPKTLFIASQATSQKTEDVIKTIYNEITNLKNNPLSNDELNTAKKILTMTFSKISENSQMLNMLLGNALLDGDLSYVENYLSILSTITSQEVSDFAKKYLDLNKISLTVVHPVTETDSSILENYEKANSVSTAKEMPKQPSFKGCLSDKMLDMQKIKQYKLSNNMEVILNTNNTDIASGQIVMQTVAPVNAKPAVPSILAVMLNSGTKDKKYEEFYKEADKAGITLKFDVDFRSVNVNVESLAQDAKLGLSLVKDVLNNPRFNESTLTYAKNFVRETLMNLEETASDNALKELFPNLSEYSTKEELLKSVEEITLDDVKSFLSHIKANSMAKAVYTAPIGKNPVLENQILNNLIIDNTKFKPFNTEVFNAYSSIKEDKVLTKAQARNQADIIQYFKFKTNYNPKDHAVFVLLNTILGGGPSSRLFEDLRETQKLAYRVTSNIDFVGDAGVMSLGIKTTTDDVLANLQQYENVEKSLKGFKKHIDMLKNVLVSEDELNAAKLRVKTKILNSLESSNSQTTVLNAAKDSFNGVNAINDNLRLIDTVSAQDIMNAARYIFAGNSITSILASQNTLDNMVVPS